VKAGARILIWVAIIVAGAAAGCARDDVPGNRKAAPAESWSRQTRVQGEYLVTVAADGDVKAIASLYGRFQVKETKDLGNNVFLVTLAEDPGPETMEKLRKGNIHIKAVQPNYIYRTQ